MAFLSSDMPSMYRIHYYAYQWKYINSLCIDRAKIMIYIVVVAIALNRLYALSTEVNTSYDISDLPVYDEYDKSTRNIIETIHRVIRPSRMITSPKFCKNSPFFYIGGLFYIANPTTGISAMDRVEILEAFRYQIRQLNDEGVLLPNTTIVYNVIDTSFVQSDSLAASIDLLRLNITAIVGPPSSNEAFVDINLLANYNVSVATHAATGKVTASTADEIFLRVVPSNEYQAHAMVALMLNMGWTLVIPVWDTSTYATTFYQSFQRLALNSNITLVCATNIEISGGDIISFAQGKPSQLFQCILDEDQANIIVVFANLDVGRVLISALASDTVYNRFTLVLSDTFGRLAINPNFYLNSEFNLSTSFLKGSIIVRPATGDITSFLNYLKTLNPYNNNYSYFNTAWEELFRCILPSSNRLLSPCKWPIDNRSIIPSCICTGNESLAEFGVDYPIGYVMDSVLVLVHALSRILTNCSSITESGIIGSDDICDSGCAQGYHLVQVAKKFPIVGHTGLLAFEGIERKYPSVAYLQFGNNGTAHSVGEYDSRIYYANITPSSFKDGVIPVSKIIPQEAGLNDPVGVIVFVLAVTMSFICVVTMIAVYLYRNRAVFKRSSPLFCEFILFGILLINVAIIIYISYPSPFSCTFQFWALILGICIIFSSLLTKTYRIYKIFTDIRVRSKPLSNVVLLKYTATFLVIEIVLLAIHLIASEGDIYTLQHDPSDYTNAYMMCQPHNNVIDITITIILIILNAAIVFTTAVLAYLTRNAGSTYSESGYIAATIYVSLLIYVVSLPLYFTASQYGKNYIQNLLLVEGISIFLASASILTLLFLPKFIEMYRVTHPESSTTTSRRQRFTSIDDSIVVVKSDDVLFREKSITMRRNSASIPRRTISLPSEIARNRANNTLGQRRRIISEYSDTNTGYS